MYDFSDYTDRAQLYIKQLPQFANMTLDEINALMARLAAFESVEWQQERDARLSAEKVEDSRYMEEEGKKAPVLPDGNVRIEKGVLITFATVDKNGFASAEDLAGCKKTWKMSLSDAKKIYL